MPKPHDNFLADAVKPRHQPLGYLDGFRFGFGFFIAGLLVMLIVGGLSWGVILLLHLR
ncbi:MAG: hypothetical protein JWN01_649 [Patescibacteria group bacterium]|nr:hypothetical protein [Patescibacteria group bacterium]